MFPCKRTLQLLTVTLHDHVEGESICVIANEMRAGPWSILWELIRDEWLLRNEVESEFTTPQLNRWVALTCSQPEGRSSCWNKRKPRHRRDAPAKTVLQGWAPAVSFLFALQADFSCTVTNSKPQTSICESVTGCHCGMDCLTHCCSDRATHGKRRTTPLTC